MVNGERFYPEHVMTHEEALETYTINGAYAAFDEDTIVSVAACVVVSSCCKLDLRRICE